MRISEHVHIVQKYIIRSMADLDGVRRVGWTIGQDPSCDQSENFKDMFHITCQFAPFD